MPYCVVMNYFILAIHCTILSETDINNTKELVMI